MQCRSITNALRLCHLVPGPPCRNRNVTSGRNIRNPSAPVRWHLARRKPVLPRTNWVPHGGLLAVPEQVRPLSVTQNPVQLRGSQHALNPPIGSVGPLYFSD